MTVAWRPEAGGPMSTRLPTRSAIRAMPASRAGEDGERFGVERHHAPEVRHRAGGGEAVAALEGGPLPVGLHQGEVELPVAQRLEVVERARRRLGAAAQVAAVGAVDRLADGVRRGEVAAADLARAEGEEPERLRRRRAEASAERARARANARSMGSLRHERICGHRRGIEHRRRAPAKEILLFPAARAAALLMTGRSAAAGVRDHAGVRLRHSAAAAGDLFRPDRRRRDGRRHPDPEADPAAPHGRAARPQRVDRLRHRGVQPVLRAAARPADGRGLSEQRQGQARPSSTRRPRSARSMPTCRPIPSRSART